MKLSYYGDKISNNMSLTPERYLCCANVPIGRTGWMDYLGQELPQAFNEPCGSLCKVYRSPEELFSEKTIASFEGKSITNTHPTMNLDISTTPMIERGHIQNVRREGDFLVADLFVKDAGLVSEIQNNLKREVSSGYDCSWHKISDGKYEQKDIIGNHVAVVQNGRAGSKVAIHDAKPEIEKIAGGKKFMGKITKKILTAMGVKAYVQDAEPEDIAKALDAMNEEDEEKEVKDSEPEKKETKDEDKKEVKDAETIPAWAQTLIEDVKALKVEKKAADDAETVMDALEEELEGEKEVKDAEPEEKEEEPKEKGKAADAALKKFVQDMKPIIMAIQDEKTRTETAKKFASTVHDARSSSTNSYANILNVVSNNKKSAMDSASNQKLTMTQAAEKSCNAWNAAGEKMKNNK